MSFASMPLYTGDYLRDTRHLSPLKHGIYLLGLMHCWDSQGPMPLDEQECAGICNCRSADEIDALRYILNRYFVRMDDGFYNKRIAEEVAKFSRMSKKFSEAGLKSAEVRRNKARAGRRDQIEQRTAEIEGRLNLGSTKVQPTSVSPSPSPSPSQEIQTESISKVVGVSRTRSTDAKGSRLPADWQLPKAWGEWSMAELHMSRDAVRLEADKFSDYWHAVAGAKGRKADWQATWRNWCRNAQTSLKTPIKGLAESFRERDARMAAERVAEATGGLSVDRSALRKPLPFEAGYVADVIEGESNVKRIA